MRSRQQRIGLNGELGRVARDPDADEAGVGGHIVDAIGHDLAEFLVLEVMHVHPPWLAFRAIIGSAVLEVADQLLFLGVDGDYGLWLGLRRHDFRVDIFELQELEARVSPSETGTQYEYEAGLVYVKSANLHQERRCLAQAAFQARPAKTSGHSKRLQNSFRPLERTPINRYHIRRPRSNLRIPQV